MRPYGAPCLRRGEWLDWLFGYIATAFTLSIAGPVIAQEKVALAAGETEVIRTERGARAIAIGNPAVASASVVSDTAIVVTAKTAGVTNLIALDEEGEEILRTELLIGPPGLAPRPVNGSQVRVRSVGGGSRGSGELVRNYICSPGALCQLTDSTGETPTMTTVRVERPDGTAGTVTGPSGDLSPGRTTGRGNGTGNATGSGAGNSGGGSNGLGGARR